MAAVGESIVSFEGRSAAAKASSASKKAPDTSASRRWVAEKESNADAEAKVRPNDDRLL